MTIITILIIYTVIVTLLYICSIIGVAQERQDHAICLKHDRIAITDLIQQLAETKVLLAGQQSENLNLKRRINSLDIENSNLKQVIARQDQDLSTSHKLMKRAAESQNSAAAPLNPLNPLITYKGAQNGTNR